MLEWQFWLPYRKVWVSCVSLWDKLLSSIFLIFRKGLCLGMRKLVMTNDDKYINKRVRLFIHHMCLHICEVHTIATVGKCIHETQKNYKFAVTNFNSTLQKKQNFWTSRSETSENAYLFAFISWLLHDWFPLEFVFTYCISLMLWEINSKK